MGSQTLRIRCESEEETQRVHQLIAQIEELRGRKLFCIYHDQTDKDDGLEWATRDFAKTALAKLGHVDKLSVLIDSPGGDADEAFRLAKLFRRYTDDLEVIVVEWCKSAATLFCLCADTIVMSRDAELGPLDVQLRNPKTGVMFSALQSFKALEYLKQYAIEVLDNVSVLFRNRVKMGYIHAVEAARPIVSDIVTSLYGQVDPSELGEARRYLAIGEEYAKLLMERYAYSHYPPQQIEKIVRTLVWNYPSHTFAVDFREAHKLGLRVERLDEATTSLCEELLRTATGCLGVKLAPETSADAVQGTGIASITTITEESHETPSTITGQQASA